MTPGAKAERRDGDSSMSLFTAGIPSKVFWGLNRGAWWRLPESVRESRVGLLYGRWIHNQVLRRSTREMYVWSTFLRNRPSLELMRRLVQDRAEGSTLEIAVLGCSVGAEVYSIAWVLRSARPDLEIALHGVDISPDVVRVAVEGVYAPGMSDLVGVGIFERLTERERQGIFHWDGDTGRVKDWLREGIEWHVDDACDPELASRIGRHDIVVASNFLCHMDRPTAEHCLRNIARLLKPGGYIFVPGVDLDVRTSVADTLGWEPVVDLLEDIHEADPALRSHWPWEWAGLEPLDRRRPDWRRRYATAFQVARSDVGIPASRV